MSACVEGEQQKLRELVSDSWNSLTDLTAPDTLSGRIWGLIIRH